MEALVPASILQPLVENAIEHGIAARKDGGRVLIVANADVNLLTLRIENDGPPNDEEHVSPEARRVGLKNTAERLRQLYGEDHRLMVDLHPAGGASVTAVFPLRFGTDSK